MNLIINALGINGLQRLQALNTALGKPEQNTYFLHQFEAQQSGDREIFIATFNNEDIGYCIYNRMPKYPPFKKLHIPEIQDLNVLPAYRRQGMGRALILHCENTARAEKFTDIGIGVGILPSYGAAQRLYVKMGYVPDGLGVNHDRKQITPGEIRPLDDDLSLMMIKTL